MITKFLLFHLKIVVIIIIVILLIYAIQYKIYLPFCVLVYMRHLY